MRRKYWCIQTEEMSRHDWSGVGLGFRVRVRVEVRVRIRVRVRANPNPNPNPDYNHPDLVGQALKAVGEQLLLEGAELVVLEVARQHARCELDRVRHAERGAVVAPAHVVVGLRLLDDRVQLGQEGRDARAAARDTGVITREYRGDN